MSPQSGSSGIPSSPLQPATASTGSVGYFLGRKGLGLKPLEKLGMKGETSLLPPPPPWEDLGFLHPTSQPGHWGD